MKKTLVVCALVLSASMLLAAQRERGVRPCKKCKDDAVKLAEKMKSNTVSMKDAIAAAEADCKGTALTGYVEWSEDGQQPFFAIFCGTTSGISVVELDHTGKVLGKEASPDLPSIHDEKTHKPAPPPRGG